MKRLFTSILLLILFLNPQMVTAAERSQATRTMTSNSASWAVAAVGDGQLPTYQPLTLTWNVLAGTAYQFFSFNNLGSTTVNSFLVTISQTASTKNGNTGDVFFERCLNGTWNTATNACSGTVILVGKATDLSFSFANAALSSNNGISMRARTPPNSKNAYVTSISTSVSRLDIRSATVTHS
jgi:hypothetical protein